MVDCNSCILRSPAGISVKGVSEVGMGYIYDVRCQIVVSLCPRSVIVHAEIPNYVDIYLSIYYYLPDSTCSYIEIIFIKYSGRRKASTQFEGNNDESLAFLLSLFKGTHVSPALCSKEHIYTLSSVQRNISVPYPLFKGTHVLLTLCS